jgi:hypothetical protein
MKPSKEEIEKFLEELEVPIHTFNDFQKTRMVNAVHLPILIQKALDHFKEEPKEKVSAEEYYNSTRSVPTMNWSLSMVLAFAEEYSQSNQVQVSDEKLEELNKEFYNSFQMIELDKHDKRVPKFDYYTLLGYAEEFYKWMRNKLQDKE